MRNRLITVAGALVFVACAYEPEPTPLRPSDAPPPAAQPETQPVARFIATLTPPSRGLGLGETRGSVVFQAIPVATGRGSGANPPRTVELFSTQTFATAPPGGSLPVIGNNPCGAAALGTNVRIRNYFPESLVRVHVAFSANSGGEANALCATGTRPDDSTANVNFGVLNHGSPTAVPVDYLPGSNVNNGDSTVAPVAINDKPWWFRYPGSGTFTIRGEVWAELYPPMPPSPFGGAPQEPGQIVAWFVPAGTDPTQSNGISLAHSHVTICSAAFVNGVCSGTILADVPQLARTTGGPVGSEWAYRLPATLPLTSTLWWRAVNVFDHDGDGQDLIEGTLAQEVAFNTLGNTAPAFVTPPPQNWDTSSATFEADNTYVILNEQGGPEGEILWTSTSPPNGGNLSIGFQGYVAAPPISLVGGIYTYSYGYLGFPDYTLAPNTRYYVEAVNSGAVTPSTAYMVTEGPPEITTPSVPLENVSLLAGDTLAWRNGADIVRTTSTELEIYEGGACTGTLVWTDMVTGGVADRIQYSYDFFFALPDAVGPHCMQVRHEYRPGVFGPWASQTFTAVP